MTDPNPVIPPPARTDPSRANLPHSINMLLGAWLVITPFLWPHTEATSVNAWITGAAIGGFAVIALYQPIARYGNTVMALWLFASAFLLPHDSTATIVNDLFVSVAVFTASLVPTGGAQRWHRLATR